MRPPPRVVATSFQRELTTGSNRPLVLRCRPTGAQSPGEDYVVKLSSDMHGSPFLELMCSQLADRLGVSVPRPALVNVKLEVAEAQALNDRDLAARLRNSIGINFGCVFVPRASVEMPTKKAVTPDIFRQASEIVAFDALIDNADRRKEKPNLLRRSDTIYVIDHELAFASRMEIGQSIQRISFDALRHWMTDHPLYPLFQGKEPELGRFVRELESLGDEEIVEILEHNPFETVSGIEGAVARIKDARDNSGRFIRELGRALA